MLMETLSAYQKRDPASRGNYQITPEDYTALRAFLSAKGAAGQAGSVHTMFFISYLDRIQENEGLAVPGQSGAQFALHYYDNDPR